METEKLESLLEELPELEPDRALAYCAGDRGFLYSLLQKYAGNGREARIEELYREGKWKEYQIEVHALKSTSLSFGLVYLSEQAEKLEMAVKSGDMEYVQKNHDAVMRHYRDVTQTIQAHA